MDITPIVTLILQGSPYAILLGGLLAVWSKYQKALEDIQKLHTMQQENQQKLVDKLLDAITEEEN